MKILVVSHTYIAPINRQKWVTLASCYDDVEIDVLFPDSWPSVFFHHQVQHLEGVDRCRFHALPAYQIGNEVRYFYHISPLVKLFKTIKPDIIQVEQGISALSYLQIVLLARFFGFRGVAIFFTWVNWISPERFKDRCFWNHVKSINQRFSAGAIAGNNAARDILQMSFDKPVAVIPQIGIDAHVFTPARRDEGQPDRVVGFVGRFVEEKGIFLLLRAFCRLADRYPLWRLAFVGHGHCYDELARHIRESSYSARIVIEPPRQHDELAVWYQRCDIFVLPSYDTPSWKEQFGHVLIEAMASGVAVIGSDAGEIPHVIADAGVVVAQRDERALEQALDRFMGDDDYRRDCGLRGRQRVLEHFTHDAIAAKSYAFWKSLRPE